MALATQVKSYFWAKGLKAVTTLPLPRRGSGRPSAFMWCSTGPRLLAKIRGRRESTESHSSWSSAMPSPLLRPETANHYLPKLSPAFGHCQGNSASTRPLPAALPGRDIPAGERRFTANRGSPDLPSTGEEGILGFVFFLGLGILALRRCGCYFMKTAYALRTPQHNSLMTTMLPDRSAVGST